VVTYAKPIGESFKTYQKFTNTDATKTNHIFKFIEKYDNIHLDSLNTQLGKLTSDGTVTIQYSSIDQNKVMQIEKSGFNMFNLDITNAYEKFQSVTFVKLGGIVDATFDYSRNAIALPVNKSQNLDPTFAYSTGTGKDIFTPVAASTSCGNGSGTTGSISIVKSDLADVSTGGCTFSSFRWNIAPIPDDATITDVLLRYDVTNVVNSINCDFNEINTYPTSASFSAHFTDIIDGTNFVSNDSGCTTVSNDKSLDLGTSADADVTAQLSTNWWAVGMTYNDKVRDLSDHNIFVAVVELQITWTGGTTPVSNFTDPAKVTGLSTNCAARTTLATLTTTFVQGNNFIIAPVQFISTDAGTETVDIRLYNATNLLVQNEFLSEAGTSGKGGLYTLLYNDIHAGANTVYTVQACLSATAVDASAQILAVSGLTNVDFKDGASTALGTGDTTIVSKATTFPAGNNLVIASIMVDNGATGQDVVAGGLRLKNNGGTEISTNQFAMSFGTAAATDIQSLTLIGKDDSAGANPTYSVTGKSANAANGEAKILIFQPKSYAFVDGGSVAINAVSPVSTLATLTTSFAANTDFDLVTASQIDDSDAGVETILAGNFVLFNGTDTSSPIKGTNIDMEGFAASGSAGDGFHNDMVSNSFPPLISSPTFTVGAVASATALNGESKMLAFEIRNPVTQTNCDACNPDPFQNVGCCIFSIIPYVSYYKEPDRIDRQ
jgi:hypothetical protein